MERRILFWSRTAIPRLSTSLVWARRDSRPLSQHENRFCGHLGNVECDYPCPHVIPKIVMKHFFHLVPKNGSCEVTWAGPPPIPASFPKEAFTQNARALTLDNLRPDYPQGFLFFFVVLFPRRQPSLYSRSLRGGGCLLFLSNPFPSQTPPPPDRLLRSLLPTLLLRQSRALR